MVDNGFVAAKAFAVSDNLRRLLENQVFIELMRRGYDTEKTIFYYRSRNDKEVDFVLRKGAHIERLVQVCYDMSSPKTEKRGLSRERIEEIKAQKKSWWNDINNYYQTLIGSASMPMEAEVKLGNETMFETEKKILQDLATNESCVVAGLSEDDAAEIILAYIDRAHNG